MRSPSTASAFLALVVALVLMAAGPADAFTYFRAETSNQTASGGATSLSINVPAGTAAGDVMLAVITSASNTGPATPSGWNLVSTASTSAGFSTGSLSVFTRVAGASEPASYSWSLGGTLEASGAVGTYVGINTTTPVQVASVASGNSKSAIASSVTTTANNTFVVAALGYNGTVPVTITNPAGTTQRGAAVSPGSFIGTVVTEFVQGTAGATGAQTFALSSKSPYGASLIALNPASPGPLQFGVTSPDVAALPSVTLNGQSQTVTTAMPNFEVDDATGTTSGTSASGWNLTVSGDSGAGKSAVFKRYCPNATCGSDTGPAYVTGGASLPANSLTLVSTGASFSGGSGTAPAFQCGSSCNVDAAAATKIVSASSAGGGLWTTSGFAANSLRLSAATTLRALPASEIYRLDLLWSLNTGP
jgi:hypothetical protein